MWVYVCTPEEHGAGTSDAQSHQTCGGKRAWLRARVSQPDGQTPRGGGLDSLIKAKHLLAPPHLQCHELPTQAAKPCLLSADTVSLLFRFIKHQSRKRYFSYKANPSREQPSSITCSQENCLTPQTLSPSSLCSFHCVSGVLTAAAPQTKEAPHEADSWQEPPAYFHVDGKSVFLRRVYKWALFSQKPNVSF